MDRKITLTLLLARQTRHAVLYELPGVRGTQAAFPFSNLYVRKDALRREGHRDFPAEIKVTVEIPE
jgi:hypothetical protein